MNRVRRVPLPEGQAELLEMIAKGYPLTDTLARLTQLIEAQSDGLYCTILLLDEDGEHIHPGAGPRMPGVYMQALEGYAIGPNVGSCGSAMFRKEAVVVTDILTDPRWAPYKHLLEPHGFRACWSTPIFLDKNTVLGSFAMYYRDVASPGPVELELMAVASHIAGIAIERKRSEEALHRYREGLEELVAARTAELHAEKDKAEAALATLNATQEELVRSKKLAALGAIVAGIAHKLNTPIGNCALASSTLADQTRQLRRTLADNQGLKRSDLHQYLSDVTSAQEILTRNLDSAANLVTTFKEIAAAPDTGSRRQFQLRDWVRQVVNAYKPRMKNIALSVEVDIPDTLQCDSYPDSLALILGYLFDNALIHAFDGRTEGSMVIRGCEHPDGMVELSVTDDGLGISADHIERIFDPFFTTKFGTPCIGLGLNIVHNTVAGILGGQIGLRSSPGQGTVAAMVFPKVARVR